MVCLWEIDVAISHMTDIEERRMMKVKVISRLKSPNELLAEGTFEDNLRSTFSSHS